MKLSEYQRWLVSGSFDEVGDLRCPGVEVEVYKEKNRAPLFKEKTNRWLLVRATGDDPTEFDVEKELYKVMGDWFDSSIDILASTEGRARTGNADNIKLKRISKEPIHLSPVSKRREDLDTLPMIKPGPHVFIEVEFDYRGENQDMPWPVWRAFPYADFCPNDADWMLVRVGEPLTNAPPERSSKDVWTDLQGKASEAITTPIKWTFAVLAAGLGIFALSELRGWTTILRKRKEPS